MDVKIILRQILTDRLSLRAYRCGDPCIWKDIQRRMLLNEKEQCPHVPDHFYRSADRLHIHQNDINSLRKLITKGLDMLSNHFLEWELKREPVIIRDNLLPEWQNTITFIPSLILVSAKIAVQQPFYFNRLEELPAQRIKNYLEDYVLPSVKYTSLPSPKIDKLNELITATGLNDLHIHLNGTTEVDIVWQDCLNYPKMFHEYFKEAAGNFLVLEQIEYEDTYKDADELYHLLLTARTLRYTMVSDYLFSAPNHRPQKWNNRNIDNINDLVVSETHPLEHFLKNQIQRNGYTTITLECLMNIMILSRLSDRSNYKYKDSLAYLYHYYLLIEGVINKFVVQQLHQKGFQQFQKIAENNFRELSERKFANRFLQLNGNKNEKYLVNHIEGRFSPGKTTNAITRKIGNINAGLEKYMHTLNIIPQPDKSELFSLTAHFIKSRDKTENSNMRMVRHEILRKELWQKAEAITDYNKIPKDNLPFNIAIVGIDAASSEFNAPPEVFAPVYRFLRKENRNLRFTFHAGEDFSHIISGLRAMYESVEFLDLQSGDRIGHGTALGICPEKWLNKMDKYIHISQGECLDNLIFLYQLLLKYTNCKRKIKKKIVKKIIRLSYEVYGSTYSITNLTKAWALRKYCPILFLSTSFTEAKALEVFDLNEWMLVKEERNKGISEEVINLMKAYHYHRNNYNDIIHLNKESQLFTINEIRYFQRLLSRHLVEKEIVIETLPTSNTRISIYDSTREHHASKWLAHEKKGIRLSRKRKHPHLVIGTDDPGIFSTNIYNEYAHLYTSLKESGEFDVDKVIEKLYDNSFRYCFPPQEESP